MGLLLNKQFDYPGDEIVEQNILKEDAVISRENMMKTAYYLTKEIYHHLQ